MEKLDFNAPWRVVGKSPHKTDEGDLAQFLQAGHIAFDIVTPAAVPATDARQLATLIAAAPCMLAALQDMVALWERVHEANGPVALGRPTLNKARAAIAKATGKGGE